MAQGTQTLHVEGPSPVALGLPVEAGELHNILGVQ